VPRRKRSLGHGGAVAPQPEGRARWVRVAPKTAVPAPHPKSRRPLSAAAFIFAIGLAITSVVPMLALGQTATAAAATAAGAQEPGQVQAWKASLTSTLPQASRDAYSTDLVKPGAALSGNGQIEWPFPFNSPIAYGFGPRIAPMEGASTFHQGVDFDPGLGTPIQIITAGTVTKVVSNPHDSLGVHVVVDHGVIDGHHIESWYCEMAPGSIKVKQGQQVAMGDIVGNVGVSGISTGAHLHLELHQDGKPVDPLAWLRAHAGAAG
jgi:murein DD-endopeptidase MepM/ murein hydrolase activator NlpD